MKPEKIKEICVKCKSLCCKVGGPIITKKEKDRILKAGFKDHTISIGRYYVFDTKNAICPYLKNNLCMLQKVKPLLCKTHPVFPVWRGKKKRYIILDCPLTPYLTEKDIQNLKQKASKIQRGVIDTMCSFSPSPVIIRRVRPFHWYEKEEEAFRQ